MAFERLDLMLTYLTGLKKYPLIWSSDVLLCTREVITKVKGKQRLRSYCILHSSCDTYSSGFLLSLEFNYEDMFHDCEDILDCFDHFALAFSNR